METGPLLEPEVAFLRQAARIPVVTNGNVTLSAAAPVTAQLPTVSSSAPWIQSWDATSEAVVWGPGLQVGGTPVPGGLGSLPWTQESSVSIFDLGYQATMSQKWCFFPFPGQQGRLWGWGEAGWGEAWCGWTPRTPGTGWSLFQPHFARPPPVKWGIVQGSPTSHTLVTMGSRADSLSRRRGPHQDGVTFWSPDYFSVPFRETQYSLSGQRKSF